MANQPAQFYALQAQKPNGDLFSFADLQGKVVVIVNTATKCGFTPQFTELQALYEQYQAQGLVVIGFPCNQFLGQAPEEDDQVEEVCQVNFGVSFPLMKKINVNGDQADPVFKYLKNSISNGILGKAIKWNFTKFIIDSQGKTHSRFAPNVSPLQMESTIVELLKNNN